MDGAGRWGKMRYITFPALQNTILTVLILNLAKMCIRDRLYVDGGILAYIGKQPQ